jgi:hypothetical protein
MPRLNRTVVLMSALPDAHEAIVRTLRLRGVTVRVPRSGTPPRALGRIPDVILVDLVHGTGASRAMVAAINRRRGKAIVVALHEGSLDPGQKETFGLVVEGYCRYGDWPRLVEAIAEQRKPVASLLR